MSRPVNSSSSNRNNYVLPELPPDDSSETSSSTGRKSVKSEKENGSLNAHGKEASFPAIKNKRTPLTAANRLKNEPDKKTAKRSRTEAGEKPKTHSRSHSAPVALMRSGPSDSTSATTTSSSTTTSTSSSPSPLATASTSTTPRNDDREKKGATSPRSPINFKAVRSNIKKFGTVNASKMRRKSSPRANSLAALPPTLRFQIKDAISVINARPGFKSMPEVRRNMILNAEIIKHLSDANIPVDNKILEGILKEKNSKSYKKQIVELDDPLYAKHMNRAATGAFDTTWTTDNASVPAELQHFVDDDIIRPTFARDFRCARYFILEKNGEKKRIDSIDEFRAFTKSEKKSDMTKMVSNIASQNLGVFFKSAIFGRQQENEGKYVYHSAVTLIDGTAVGPNSRRGMDDKAEYVLSKDESGRITLTYQRTLLSSAAEPLSVKSYGEESNLIDLRADAALRLTAVVTIETDGNWAIANPEIETYNFEPA